MNMKKKISLFIAFLIPLLSYGDALTANILTNYKQISVTSNVVDQKNGSLKTPLCSRCPVSILNITPSTILLVNGNKIAIEELLSVSLSKTPKLVRLQYYKNSFNINYIEWGESELDKRLLQ